ncbi:DNA repair protein recA homolog 2, mitochondrial-like [Triticum aestivum]|uniref:DNA repair protein recA homolog 2, mitochondrial-like n=1 Tax=Triticum aestivum TaxID=4565 RepID=UPI001D032980|nr:DNA repair protein recA homolog 2, mitochondrial-like [Triticum aestivum]
MQSDYESDPPLDDEKSLEKVSTLNGAVSQLASDFDRDSNLCLERFSRTRRASVISTGSLKLDLALGIGGLPKGRMVEIFGKESSGKTTLALHVIKEAQKNGGYCAYIDAENAFNTSFAEEIGVDIDKLLIAQPDSAENSLSIVNTLVGGSIDVVVVDSVAALIPKCELEGEIYMKFKDAQSRLMTRALRKVQYTLSRSETLIIFVNQVRTKRSSDPSPRLYKEVTCGGNALGFYSAIRMRTSRRKLHYSEDEATGISIAVQIIKNKLVPAALTSAEPEYANSDEDDLYTLCMTGDLSEYANSDEDEDGDEEPSTPRAAVIGVQNTAAASESDKPMDHTEALPDDALAAILGRLARQDLAACRRVRRAWLAIVDGRRLLPRNHHLPDSVEGIFAN